MSLAVGRDGDNQCRWSLVKACWGYRTRNVCRSAHKMDLTAEESVFLSHQPLETFRKAVSYCYDVSVGRWLVQASTRCQAEVNDVTVARIPF